MVIAGTTANITMSAAQWLQVLLQTSQCQWHNNHRYFCKHHDVCHMMITGIAANIMMSAKL
jgi:hypothetical protein